MYTFYVYSYPLINKSGVFYKQTVRNRDTSIYDYIYESSLTPSILWNLKKLFPSKYYSLVRKYLQYRRLDRSK